MLVKWDVAFRGLGYFLLGVHFNDLLCILIFGDFDCEFLLFLAFWYVDLGIRSFAVDRLITLLLHFFLRFRILVLLVLIDSLYFSNSML